MTIGANHKRIEFLRPLLPLAAATAAGICVANAAGNLNRTLLWTLPLALAFVLTVDVRPAWLTMLIPLIFMIASCRTGIVLDRTAVLVAQADKERRILTGYVADIPKHGNTVNQAVIRRPDGTRVQLYYYQTGQALRYGDWIEAAVFYELPRGQRNPGGFNESAWLAGLGIFVKAKPAERDSLTVTRPAPAVNLIDCGANWRKFLTGLLKSLLSDQQANILSGLLMGETQGISQKTRSDFRQSGLAHLMSVSGTHVSFLLLPASRMLRGSGLRRRRQLILLLALLAGYGFLTGWRTSVARAILMAGCVLAGRLLHRPADSISSLSLAVIVLLVFQPFTLLSSGFWLSLSATASLALLAGPLRLKIESAFHRIPSGLAAALAAGLCIQLWLMPLLAWVNQSVSLVGLFCNLPAGFLASAICLLMTILLPAAGLLYPVLPGAASAIAAPMGFLADMLAGLASLAGQIRMLRLPRDFQNPAFWFVWLLFVTGWTCGLLAPHRMNGFWQRLIWHLRIYAILIWQVVSLICMIQQPPAEVWFLDVGQGDAILITSRQGGTILIDGGNPGQGWHVIMPALDYLGIDRVDVLIATHGHSDHVGGLVDVLEAGRADLLMVSAQELRAARSNVTGQETDILYDLLDAAESQGIRVSELTGNDTITLGPLISIYVKNQKMATVSKLLPGYDANNCSLILDARLADCRVLLTGDCTLDLEKNLIEQGLLQPGDVLKVAHHGSGYATTKPFLDVIAPRAAVISVGPNIYGHPADETLQRLDDAGCPVWRTDRSGAIRLHVSRNGWTIGPACPQISNKQLIMR